MSVQVAGVSAGRRVRGAAGLFPTYLFISLFFPLNPSAADFSLLLARRSLSLSLSLFIALFIALSLPSSLFPWEIGKCESSILQPPFSTSLGQLSSLLPVFPFPSLLSLVCFSFFFALY